MEETYNLNKTSWFVNPWFDSIFLAGFPTALIIVLLINYIYFSSPHILFDSFANFNLYSLFNFPHIVSGVSIIYLDQRERKGQSLKFLWIPFLFLLSMIGLVAFGIYYNFTGRLSMFRGWWGSLHNLFQSYYILELYGLRNNDHLKVDKIIDISFLAVIYIDFSIRIILLRMGEIGYIDTSIIESFFIFWGILTSLVVTIFIIRQAYLFIRYKKIHPFKIMMLSAAFIAYYSLLITTRSTEVAWRGQVLLHCLQWIALVWVFNRQKFKEGIAKGARLISYLSQPGHTKLYIFILISFSVVFNFSYLIFSRQFKIPFNTIINLVQPSLALFHFFIEIFIWRSSSLRRIVSKSA